MCYSMISISAPTTRINYTFADQTTPFPSIVLPVVELDTHDCTKIRISSINTLYTRKKQTYSCTSIENFVVGCRSRGWSCHASCRLQRFISAKNVVRTSKKKRSLHDWPGALCRDICRFPTTWNTT